MKQPRWLRRIVLQADAATTSYWEQRDWAGEVPVKTTSRIDPVDEVTAGTPIEITGMAFAGARGVAAVEISWTAGAAGDGASS